MAKRGRDARVENGMTGTLYPSILLVSSLLAGGAFLIASPSREAVGPNRVRFNHAQHVSWGLTCDSCHVGVLKTDRAVIPRKGLCALCHSEPVLGTEGEALLLREMERPGELLWPNPRFLPEHVIFSHRRHVVVGGIPCEDCHGPVGSSTELPGSATARHLDMDGCMDCHEERDARTDCFDCHR